MNLMSYDFHSYFSKVSIQCDSDDTGWLPHSTCNQNRNIDVARDHTTLLSGTNGRPHKLASGASSGDRTNILFKAGLIIRNHEGCCARDEGWCAWDDLHMCDN